MIKGGKHTKKSKEMMSQRMMGENNPFYGKTHTKAVRELISKRQTGSKHTEEQKIKIGLKSLGNKYRLGTKQTEEAKKKIRESCRGEKAYQWIKDRSQLKRYNDTAKDRRSYAYNEWRLRVLIRDTGKCKMSNKDCEGRIEVHHILGFTEHPELRYDINNGITLCHFHHPRKRVEEVNLSPYFQELVKNVN